MDLSREFKRKSNKNLFYANRKYFYFFFLKIKGTVEKERKDTKFLRIVGIAGIQQMYKSLNYCEWRTLLIH